MRGDGVRIDDEDNEDNQEFLNLTGETISRGKY